MRTANTMRRTMRRIWIPLGALAAAAGGITAADTACAEPGALYRWESADGTVSFTDDAKRIPERYRDGAATIDRTVLADYGRFTPTDAAASAAQAERLEKRLAALRAANAATSEASEEAGPAPRATVATRAVERDVNRRRRVYRADGSYYYQYSRNRISEGGVASLPVDPEDPNPVVTERRRVNVPDAPITQSIIVTRQGDRVLSVEKPRSHYHTLEFGEMSDYENAPE
jgi:hypothetical protein